MLVLVVGLGGLFSQALSDRLVVIVPWESEQEDHKFKISLGNQVRHCLKIEKKKKKGGGRTGDTFPC